MDSEYLSEAQREIQQWESEKPGFLMSAFDFIYLPAANAARTLIPHGVRQAVGKATYEVLLSLNSTTQLLSFHAGIRQKLAAAEERLGDGLRAADAVAKGCWNRGIAYGAGEGGAAGAIGLFGLAADIPALLTLSLRLIQQVGVCYGYDMSCERESEHALHVLRLGAASTLKAKMEFLLGLKEIQRSLVQASLQEIGGGLVRNEVARISTLATLREFAEKLGVQLTTRKALQLVPVVGALIGGSFNAMFVNDVGRAAYMAFRRRRIAELLQTCEATPAGA